MSATVSFYLEQAAPPSETFGGWFAWRSIESPREEVGWGATKEAAIASLLAETAPELQPISVKDRLPQDGQMVLFSVLNPTPAWRPHWRSGSFVNKGPDEQYFSQRSSGNTLAIGEVSHWLPAPPGPKAGKGLSDV